jgi:hypothetical protein
MTSASLARVIVFISNHSHDSSGELYVGPNLCGPVSYVRSTFPMSQHQLTHTLQFMDCLFPGSLAAFLKPKTTTLFMLSCGALARETVSFQEFLEATNS